LFDDVRVPARLDEGETRRFVVTVVLSHGSRLIVVTTPKIRERGSRAARRRAGPPTNLSFIRTLTVGFGFTPNLLTPAAW
jgi:hypothetical protein